jgi:hypothetical protein
LWYWMPVTNEPPMRITTLQLTDGH